MPDSDLPGDNSLCDPSVLGLQAVKYGIVKLTICQVEDNRPGSESWNRHVGCWWNAATNGSGLRRWPETLASPDRRCTLHFKSKADLLVATAQHVDEVVGVPEILRPVREAKTPLEALDKGVEAYAAIEPHIYDIASVIYAARRSDEAAEAAGRTV